MNKLITPRRLPGFLELEPIKQKQFNEMEQKIKEVFEKHSFVPLDTPILEFSDILLAKSGGDVDKEIYRFTKGSTDMCMRYDLTVPLARYVAMNLNELNFPFKRYQIGKVFRGERPQKGRLREFFQCDADIIGNGDLSIVNDAECVSLYKDIFKTLNLDAIVEISNRKILGGLINSLELQKLSNDIFIALDKIDKIGEEGVKEVLLEKNIPAEKIISLINLCKACGNIDEVLSKIENICQDEEFLCGVKEIKELDSYLKAMGLTEKDYIFKLAIIRGHNYYTGTVFEAYLNGHRDFGAVGGGGRYENLASYYTEQKLPGVGMSIGFSRLFDILSSNELLPKVTNATSTVTIIPLGETLLECIALQKILRDNDITTEVSAENKSFKSKMKDANKKETPFVVILGENEVKDKVFALKDMTNGEQFNLDLNGLILKLKQTQA